MSTFFKKTTPFVFILLGLFLLFYMGIEIPAGVCLLLGIVMIVEHIWPEKWEAEKKNS